MWSVGRMLLAESPIKMPMNEWIKRMYDAWAQEKEGRWEKKVLKAEQKKQE